MARKPMHTPPSVGHSLRPALLLAVLAGGCIIPLGPQFDDQEFNYPPYVESSSPIVGEIFTPGMAGQGRDISTTLSDQNVNDHLFIRWLVDYPGTDTNPAHLVRSTQFPPSGEAKRGPIHLQPTCRDLGVGPGIHRFLMAVSDRPYLDALSGEDVDPEAPLDSVPGDANRIRLVWLINCP
jgi:hypothetical protein